MSERSRSFSDPDQLIGWLQQLILKPQCEALEGAMLSAAIDGGCRLIFGRLTFRVRCEHARPALVYPDFQLREEWIPRELVAARLRGFCADGGTVDGVQLSSAHRAYNARFLVGPLGTASGYNEWVITMDTNESVNSGDVSPIAAFGLPTWFSSGHAVSEFVLHETHPWQPGLRLDNGRLEVIIPDARVALKARWDGRRNQLAIDLSGQVSWTDVEVEVIANGAPTIRERAAGRPGRQDLPIPPDADSVLIAVNHRQGDLLASALLRRPFVMSAGWNRDSAARASADEIVFRDLQSGEGDRVEFKPFIGAKHPKETEIIEAAIAFANTSGGAIYIGVDRRGNPQEQKDLYAVGFKGPDALKQAQQRVSELIADSVKPVPPFSCDVVNLAERAFLRVTVERGPRPWYSTHQHDVYIRKGATNRKPDPQTEMLSRGESFDTTTAYPFPSN